MDGITTGGGALFTLAVIPEHPEFTIANNATDKTRAQRFIFISFKKSSPARLVSIALKVSRRVCVLPARTEQGSGGYTTDGKREIVGITTALRARNGSVRFLPEGGVSLCLTPAHGQSPAHKMLILQEIDGMIRKARKEAK